MSLESSEFVRIQLILALSLKILAEAYTWIIWAVTL